MNPDTSTGVCLNHVRRQVKFFLLTVYRTTLCEVADDSTLSALRTQIQMHFLPSGEYSANLDSVVIREPMPCEDRIRARISRCWCLLESIIQFNT